MSNFLKKAAKQIALLLVSPFMVMYLLGDKIVQGAKFLINKIKGN